MKTSPKTRPGFVEVPLLIVFINFTRYTAQADRLDDLEVARVLDRFYELCGSRVAAAGGRVVKVIGDGALFVFPADRADAGVLALLDLKQEADRFMEEQGWECRLLVKIHYGTVVEGQFGAGPEKRYDILGKAVNIAARLAGSGVVVSTEAFGQLGPAARRRFAKDAPPDTYILRGDVPRPRWSRGA